jgi:hypothetical protein
MNAGPIVHSSESIILLLEGTATEHDKLAMDISSRTKAWAHCLPSLLSPIVWGAICLAAVVWIRVGSVGGGEAKLFNTSTLKAYTKFEVLNESLRLIDNEWSCP